jgi:predicted ATPase/DNA-binding SARP family transcriptional activator
MIQGMEVRWLGPLEVRDGQGDGARVVAIPGQRLRLLLGRLALQPGGWVSADALMATVWAEDPPADPTNSLQSLVSRLRRVLGHPDLVEQSPAGYRLALTADAVDGTRFARLVAEASRLLEAGRDADAADAVDRALALWRGDPLPDDTSVEADAVRASLDDLRLQALRDRARLAVRAGRAADVVAELDELAGAYPLREDLVATLMDALVAAGRPAEALAAYEGVRSTLAEILGTDPSPALREKHLAVLRLADRPAAPGTNLRAALTSFVGRDDDVRAVLGRLRAARLVTVVGAGGSGKTRLAQEVAAGVLRDQGIGAEPAVPDGAWLVELAPVTEPTGVAQAVLDALGVRDVALPEGLGERRHREGRERLMELLAGARMLLVVDNCEHLVDAVADLLEELLGRCPGVRVLATSREPLGIAGEVLQPLGPLPVPPEGADLVDAEESPALRLFVDRARAVDPDVELDRAAVEIVRRLDGLPLAIELAAARLRALSTEEVAARLADRFRLLTGGRRTATPRHRTLRAVVEWSWDLLSDVEREVAEHVGVFASGATPEAVAAVCPSWVGVGGAGGEADVVDVLQALVDKSLLVADRTPTGTRFRMLETLREYGTEQLAERGLLTAARAAHAAYFARLVARADTALRGHRQLEALRLLDTEHEDVLAAVRYLADSGDASGSLDFVLRLGWYWMVRENADEARRWLRVALDVPGAGECSQAPTARGVLAVLSMSSADVRSADVRRDDMVQIAGRIRASALDHPLAAILPPLLLMFADEREASAAELGPALAHPEPWVRAAARMMRVAIAENDGDVETMRHDVEASVEEWAAIGDGWGIATALATRGQLRTMDGDLQGAADDFQVALRHITDLGSTNDHTMITMRLADLRLRAGRPDEARALAAAMSEGPGYGSGELLRKLMTTVVTASIAMYDDDEREMSSAYDELLALLATLEPPTLIMAHGGAVGDAVSALLALRLSGPGRAREHLRAAYAHGLITQDRPIMAVVAVSVAYWLRSLGSTADAARMLGIATRLRGAEDATSPMISRLTEDLRADPGADFDRRYAQGRALDPLVALAEVDPARYDTTPAGALR